MTKEDIEFQKQMNEYIRNIKLPDTKEYKGLTVGDYQDLLKLKDAIKKLTSKNPIVIDK